LTASESGFLSDNEAPQDPENVRVNLNDEKTLYKVILQRGDSVSKPGPIDEVKIRKGSLEGDLGEEEVVLLGRGNLSADLETTIVSMRRGEICQAFTEDPCKVELVDWVSIHDLKGDGTLIKRILKRGVGYDRVSFKDDIKFDVTVEQNGAIIYERKGWQTQADPALISDGLFDVLKSMKLNEEARITVEGDIITGRFAALVQAEKSPALLWVSLHDIQSVEDLYMDGSFFKRVLVDGEGKNIPNSNARMQVRYRLELCGSVVAGNWESEEPLRIILDECDVPSIWTHCFRQMKEGDEIQVECNLMGLHAYYLSDGLNPAYNFDTYVKDATTAYLFLKLVEFEMGKTNYNFTLTERREEALRIKDTATRLFMKQQWERALEKYEAAQHTLQPVADDPHNMRPIQLALLSNVCLCHMKLGNYHEAESHATQVLDLNVNDVKALFRRAQSRRELMNYDGALKDLFRAKDLATEQNTGLAEVLKEIQLVKSLAKRYYQQEKQIYSQISS